MKKIGLKVLNVGIAFIMLFSGVAGLGDVLLNAAEITTANPQNEPETTTSVGDEETSEVVEETTTEETTVAVEESTDVIKSAAEESNMVVQAAISEEEQQLLNQLNPRMKSLESEQTDFLTVEDTPESFIVFLKEDQQLYNSATEVFSASAGKSVAPELSTLIVKKDEANLPDEQFINTLSNLSSVESVVKNTVSQMTNYEVSAEKLDTTVVENFSTVDSYGVPNDPVYPYQWEMQQMQMSKVWDLGTGKGVKIGVFDTGFQSAYSDTRGVEFDTNRILPLVKYAEDNACYSHGSHGTKVLSIAGAVKSNNGVGMAGVASGATFQPYMAGYSCSDDGFGLSSANFVKVYEHALANGVNIMNMSFGGPYYQSAQDTVIKRATSKGLISVAARGNDGRKINPTIANYPACYGGVIMVGALTMSNKLADFSTYSDCGNKNLVTAYGDNVITATFENGSDEYWVTDGTSFSSPITASVLAVMKSVKPTATATELKNALLSTATDLEASGYDQIYGYGGINPWAAIQKLNPYVVKDGNYTFYLNKDMSIGSASLQDDKGKVVKRFNFYPNTKYDSNKMKHVLYIYNIDGKGKISYAEKRADNTAKTLMIYTFHVDTAYDSNRWNHVQFEYGTDANGYISYSRKKENGTAKIQMIYTFYANTKYDSNRWNHVQYEYGTDANGYMSYARKKENGTAKIQMIYTFYANTKYDSNRWNHVQYEYGTDANGYISYARKKENNTAKIQRIYNFYAKTVYDGNRWNHVLYEYYVDSSGYLTYAIKKANNTAKPLTKYIFKPRTVYDGNRWNNVKQTINL